MVLPGLILAKLILSFFMTTKSILEKIPYFECLTEDQYHKLLQIGQIKHIEKDQVLLKEGEQVDRLYLLLEGEVKVSTEGIKNNHHYLTLRSGNSFYEQALFKPRKINATITCLTSGKVFTIKHQDFLALISKSMEFVLNILQGLNHKYERNKAKFYHEVREKLELQYKGELERYRSISQMVNGVALPNEYPIRTYYHECKSN